MWTVTVVRCFLVQITGLILTGLTDNRAASGGAGGTTTSATGAAYGHTGTTGTAHVGPHSSNVANNADPRVTGDPGPYGTAGGVTAGGARDIPSSSTNAGPHDSNVANKLDPRVDSDRDNRARHQALGSDHAPTGTSYATPGTGHAQQTAGPHNSNLVNKLDPRVDSDLDNSRTVGNATRY